jgi:hypothetical protein
VLLLLTLLGGALWWRALRDLPSATGTPPAVRGPGDSPGELAKKPMRVLFVGNSYTYVNDLPSMIRHMAAAGGNTLRFEGVQECPGGFDLRRQWESGKVVELLKGSHFDWMVLQDQSQEPSFRRAQLETDMYPYATRLHAAAKTAGTRTLFFMTWARRNGDPDNVPGDSYEAMQTRLAEGYEGIAGSLGAPIAPVGVAWRNAVGSQPALTLWRADGSHPTAAGTYLAACVFYNLFYGHSPVGNGYTADLDVSVARTLQRVAAETVTHYPQPQGTNEARDP